MRDLSVLIASRNERFLLNTIQDVLTHAEADTEVIAVLDGAWAEPRIPDHANITLVYVGESVGQRAATNMAARLSSATFVMKLDAHCAVEQGFDAKLIEPYASKELERDVTTIPRLYNLHCFDWRCPACDARQYQGAKPTQCPTCHATVDMERVMVWQPRWSRMTDFNRFDSQLHYQYWQDYRKRPEAQGEICDDMTALGACFFMRRDRFWELGGMDEAHGSWGQFGVEVALKSWLSGGRHVVNKRTWYSHMFRTHGGPEWGFPYPLSNSQVEQARHRSHDLWIKNQWPQQVRPLEWLIEKFWPVPDWCQAEGAAQWGRVQAASLQFKPSGSEAAA